MVIQFKINGILRNLIESIVFHVLYFNLQILPLFQEAEDKNRLLRTVAGGGLETISNLKAKWDKFELMMESHQLMIKDQVRTFQSFC